MTLRAGDNAVNLMLKRDRSGAERESGRVGNLHSTQGR